MFETHKIDAFFSGEQNLLDEQETIYTTRRMKVVRFLRLFLPCLTALLLGLGVVLFDFETNNDSAIALADKDRVYFEKFHIKNTVFEITDLDNQFSVLKADTIDEVSAGKKLYDLANPQATTTDKNKKITLIAKTGQYNQNTQELKLNTDVVANYNGQMEIKTNSGVYNFATETGYGNEKVIGNGEKGYFEADKFTFNKKKGEITLINNVYLRSNDMKLNSPTKATLFMHENKFISDNATVVKNKDTLYGDIVTVYFKDTKNFEIDKANSLGNTKIIASGKTAYADKGEYFADTEIVKLYDNVKIVDKSGYVATSDYGIYDSKKQTFTLEQNVRVSKENNIVTAPRATYFQNKNEFRFYDGVKVSQDGSVATAKSGVYFIKKNIAELEHNVVITKDGNIVRGDKAISDFNTSKSRLVAKKGGRISGKLIEK